MIPAKIEVQLNEKELKEYIKQQIDQLARQEYLFVDIKRLEEITCMSRKHLEENFLNDPRVRSCERRRTSGKRFWLYEEVIQALKEVADDF